MCLAYLMNHIFSLSHAYDLLDGFECFTCLWKISWFFKNDIQFSSNSCNLYDFKLHEVEWLRYFLIFSQSVVDFDWIYECSMLNDEQIFSPPTFDIVRRKSIVHLIKIHFEHRSMKNETTTKQAVEIRKGIAIKHIQLIFIENLCWHPQMYHKLYLILNKVCFELHSLTIYFTFNISKFRRICSSISVIRLDFSWPFDLFSMMMRSL